MNLKKKKIFLHSLFSGNLFFFFREKNIIYSNRFSLNFLEFRKVTKKKNFIRTNLISLEYFSRLLRKRY